MCFGFTKELEAFRKKIRDLLRDEIEPKMTAMCQWAHFPRDLWRFIGESGLLGIGLPEEYGGQPGDNVLRAIVAEEMGRVDLSLSFALIPSYGTSLAILYGGSTLQKERWIPGLIKGEIFGSVAMTEPDCGSDLSLIRTRAIRKDNQYIINGEKSYVSWGLIADVNWLFVKSNNNMDSSGLTSLLIPLDLPGIVKVPFQQMGLESLGHCSLFMEEVGVPIDAMLGEEGKALILAAKVFPYTRMLLSLSALGVASVSLEQAIDFAKKHMAFGKPIGKFEDIAFLIAEDATLMEAASALSYRTLWLMEQDGRWTKEIAMCKWWSTDVAYRIIKDSIMIHGHRGYSKRLPLERRFRDIIGYEIAEATPQILKLSICEEILGRELRPFC